MATVGSGKHCGPQGGERSLTGVSVSAEALELLQSCRITSWQEMKLMLPFRGFFWRELLEKASYHWFINV